MLTADGVVVAMDDAAIVWKPRDGKQKRVRLEARASVLLGLVGPLGVVDKIVVGDVYGGINFISLSNELVNARENIHENLSILEWNKGFYRKDIAFRVIGK